MVNMSSGGGRIPVIDMEDFPVQSEKLIAACEEWGTFRIINHGISPLLMSEMKSVVNSLHSLPYCTKQRNANAKVADRGYIAPYSESSLFESFGIYDPASPGTVDAFCDQLLASSQQRKTIMKYFEATNELALDIGRKLEESMGWVSNYSLFKGWPCQFRLNKYNFTPQTLGSTGVQIHSDPGFLTILQDDESAGGLEVMAKKSAAFIPVDPMPGALLVNLGELAKLTY